MADFLFPDPPVLFQPQTPAQINSAELQIADVLGLKTTSWEQGDPTRTNYAVVANLLSLADVDISLLAQGGFLDYAANGSITYTDPVSGAEITVYVTPDPANPSQNPTGALGILDVLAFNVYDVLRTLASKAGGTLAIANTSASTYGPFEPEGYHVAQPAAVGSPTYSNTATISIVPSATAGAGISGATNATPIAITDVGHGRATGDLVFIQGVLGNTAANGWWVITKTGADTFTLNSSVGNGAYTGGGLVYVPQTAPFTADVAGTASNAARAGVVTQPVTSLIGVSVWNTGAWIGANTETNAQVVVKCRLKLQSLSPNGSKGAYEYFALQSQVYAQLLTPPETLTSPITRAKVVPDKTTGTVTVTVANGGGEVSGPDVQVVDDVIEAYCVPEAVTAIVQSAAQRLVPAEFTVWVPNAYKDAIVGVAQAAVQAYFAALPIGGVTDPTEASPNVNVIPYNAVIGAIFNAAANAKIPIQQVTGTIDGGTANVQLLMTPVPEVAVLDVPPIFVTPVPV